MITRYQTTVVGATGAKALNENNGLDPMLGNSPVIESNGEFSTAPEQFDPFNLEAWRARELTAAEVSRLAARHSAQAIHLSRLERLALKGLDGSSFDWGYFPFKRIARKGLPLPQVRRAVRALARKGVAVYGRGLFTEDGEVAGAGYALTLVGLEALEIEKARGEK